MRSLARSIENHNRAVLEATWTPEEALAWALTRYPGWTRKRYRVEGTRAGNSRLMMRSTAELLKMKLGGRVVEVIPTQKEWEKAKKAAEKEKPCPDAENVKTVESSSASSPPS